MNEFEIKIREDLLRSSQSLIEGDNNQALRLALLAEFSDLKYAFVVRHTPEQDEDIFEVAVPPNHLISIEISRSDSFEPVVEHQDFQHYRKQRLGKSTRRKIEVVAKIFKELR